MFFFFIYHFGPKLDTLKRSTNKTGLDWILIINIAKMLRAKKNKLIPIISFQKPELRAKFGENIFKKPFVISRFTTWCISVTY